jgi:hypothetical protein
MFLPGRLGRATMVAVLALYGMLLQSFFAGIVGASAPAPLLFEASAFCVSEQAEGFSGSGPEAPSHSNSHACICAAMCQGRHHGGTLAGVAIFALDVLRVSSRLAVASDPAPAPGLRLPPARGPPHDDRATFA